MISGYPPYGVPKPVADDVWIVEAEPIRPMGMKMPVRMVVLRLSGGDLLLHSPTRYTADMPARLADLGRIRWLVAPNVAHWMFVREWQQGSPQAETWAAPSLTRRRQVRRSGIRFDHVLTDAHPEEWHGALDVIRIPGGLGFEEFAFFHHATRTLVLTDLVVNLEPEKTPALYRPLLEVLGMMAPDGRAPAYVRAVIKLRRSEAARAVERLFACEPERVLFAHGRWFDSDASGSLRRSLRWLRS